jgi:4-alpha-glucanotransferase
MRDAAVLELASRAGIAVDWIDYAGQNRRVSIESMRSVLAALGLPCETSGDLAQSREKLAHSSSPALVTATVGSAIDVPSARASTTSLVHLQYEDGTRAELLVRRTRKGLRLPAVEIPGYHIIDLGGEKISLAVAPKRCFGLDDVSQNAKMWGIAAQVYGLRSAHDCGIGDMAGVGVLAKAAASLGADALALSPVHALFAAMPDRFSPYAPSNRLFYNPLYADACCLFDEERIRSAVRASGATEFSGELTQRPEIDWPQSSHVKMSVLRRLFDDFQANELAALSTNPLAADFAAFRAQGGSMLEDHARFETVQSAMLKADARDASWADWPAEWRDPRSATIRDFARQNAQDVLFNTFLQWVADRSFSLAQREAKAEGMKIGLLADLAVGMSNDGSHAWTSQSDILGGLEIGAPPDLFNVKGQNWGLTTFSPRALVASGFAPFIATLRATLRNAGGVRVDHAMGLLRLWVIPRGAPASEGAYLAYPVDDLLRLTALESQRHRAIVIGEDLGTVPDGFQDRLASTNIYGMRVLWFEREKGGFLPPCTWSTKAAAMTSTHDLPTVAGWWRGHDIDVRAQCGLVKDEAQEKAARIEERSALWQAFRTARVEEEPMPALEETSRIVDAAVKFVALASSELVLLPLEDALGLQDQPNLPSTIDEHPNWRRRYPGEAATLLSDRCIVDRLSPLNERTRS